jgi:hypothetical protein
MYPFYAPQPAPRARASAPRRSRAETPENLRAPITVTPGWFPHPHAAGSEPEPHAESARAGGRRHLSPELKRRNALLKQIHAEHPNMTYKALLERTTGMDADAIARWMHGSARPRRSTRGRR